MSGKSFRGWVLVLLAMGLLSVPALSQVKAVAEMTCDFNVEDTMLPAGRYNLRQPAADQFVIQSPDLKVAVVFMTAQAGAVKGGPALLAGLLRCGQCARKDLSLAAIQEEIEAVKQGRQLRRRDPKQQELPLK